MDQLTDCFACVNKNISVYYSSDDKKIQFFDYVAFLDNVYHNKIDSPWCSEGCIFPVTSENPGKLVIMADDLTTARI